jgi:alginate O-acetyltransferase complex protein AlgI
MYHGLFLLLERVGLDKIISKMPSPLRVAYTLFVVMIGWVFFRAEQISEAWIFIGRMFGISNGTVSSVFAIEFINPKVIILLVIAILYSFRIFRAVSDKVISKFTLQPVLEYRFYLAKFMFAAVLFFFALAYLAANTYNPFIYFRF